MKSITKRRLKTRSIGRNTLHKRRHSNRRWGAGQNKSRKKRMIGGAVDKYKGGVDLSNMFNRSGWKCKCTTTPQDPSSKSAPDTAIDVEPPMGQPRRPNARNSIAAVTAPVSSSFGFRRHKAPPKSSTATIDSTRSGVLLDHYDYKQNKNGEIVIASNRGYDSLPRFLKNDHIITKINDIDIRVGTLAEFYQLLDDNKFYDNPVTLTLSGKYLGGTNNKTINVSVKLKRVDSFHNGGGGKKTTYRRKKHVTQRKLNTKRMKVMVGGTDFKKQVICECTKEDKKAPRRNQISPTSPTPSREFDV